MPDERTVYNLARLADCGEPDTDQSPGAHFLRSVEDATREAWAAADEDDDTSGLAHEIADAAVPVYTHERWEVFVDLAAYGEDPTT